MPAPGKRSFWLHQLAEYIVGGAMLASGLQSPKPLIPAIVGSLILLNTAIVDAPFGAFRLVGRRLHRILDYIVLGIATVACAAPGMDVATRLVQILIVIVLAVVVFGGDDAIFSAAFLNELGPGFWVVVLGCKTLHLTHVFRVGYC